MSNYPDSLRTYLARHFFPNLFESIVQHWRQWRTEIGKIRIHVYRNVLHGRRSSSPVESISKINSDKISGKSDSFFFCLPFFSSKRNVVIYVIMMIGEVRIGATAATLNVCLNMMDWCMGLAGEYTKCTHSRCHSDSKRKERWLRPKLYAWAGIRCVHTHIHRHSHPGYWSQLEFAPLSCTGDTVTLWFVIETKLARAVRIMRFTNLQLARRKHTMEAIQNKSITNWIQWNW